MAISDNQAPRFEVKVAGRSCTHAQPNGLESFTVEDEINQIGKCELTFGMGATWSFARGQEVEVTLGDDTYKVFKGKVDAFSTQVIGGVSKTTVVALCPLNELANNRTVDAKFDEMPDSDIARQIMDKVGVEVGTIDTTSEKRKYTIQRNRSAYAMLRELTSRNPAYVLTSTEGKVEFKKLQLSNAAIDIPGEKLHAFNVDQAARPVPDKIKAISWDYMKKQKVEGEASHSDVPMIGSGTPTTQGTLWKGGPAVISDAIFDSQQTAKDVAATELFWQMSNAVRGYAIVQGSGQYHAGVKVRFTGNAEGHNPEALIKSSQHTVFVGSGSKTRISFISNTWGDGSA